jgi:hypothetical protein
MESILLGWIRFVPSDMHCGYPCLYGLWERHNEIEQVCFGADALLGFGLANATPRAFDFIFDGKSLPNTARTVGTIAF